MAADESVNSIRPRAVRSTSTATGASRVGRRVGGGQGSGQGSGQGKQRPTPARKRVRKPESPLALTRRARQIDRILATLYPDAHCELNFSNPLELSVATILSAQCTDKRVNDVTPELFRRYRTAADYAGADRAQLEDLIRPTGFFRNKANSIIRLGQQLTERFDGQVPRRLDQLVTLPGFGRKTANVVLGNAYGIAGLTIDTHFGRLARRFGWTAEEDPVKVEAAVAQLLPKKDWTDASHRIIWHGRRVCHARKPACGACAVAALCPSYGLGPTDPIEAGALVKSGPEVAVSA